ncbi:hypothetical protein LAZ67_8001448 [Cordylochernes scorpioides]|uniref:Reverse transcriptase domain-containing protein n=1 Tax=Cordylochernes scorpioides TaxID=51811 RepID=A0ABY6KQ86_9ARAC|nr:hypothetical protein LAZ67_8001448 [Cordylochernes scorpioides]
MAKTKREKDVEFAYQVMPSFVKYNNNLNIKTWIINFERKSDSYGFYNSWKVLHLADYLQDEALTYYFESLCHIEDWNTLKENLITRFQKTKLTPLVEIMKIIQEENETVTQYYHRKMQLINSVELNLTSIIELLNEGIKKKFKPYLATIDSIQPSEWLLMATKIEKSLEEPQQPSTSTRDRQFTPVKFNPNYSQTKKFQPFPMTSAATHHLQETHKTIKLPPYPCKICSINQIPNQMHFHRDCPLNNTPPKPINPDASSLGVAGVLKQPDEQCILCPIGYFSRKLHPYEQNYTASEIETLAIINSMDRSIEQRYAIKFCFRLGKNASETFAMITEAYKEDTLSRAQVFRWFNEFKNGRESVEDMERSGRPSTSRVEETVAKVKEPLDSDRPLYLKMIADEVSVNKFTVRQIVTQDLMMRKVCAKLVPRVLTAEQKQRRVDVCREMRRIVDIPIRPGDESPELGVAHTGIPAAEESKNVKVPSQDNADCVFRQSGVNSQRVCPSGDINAEFYNEVLRRLHKAVKRKRQDLAQRWRLHHDNAPAHTAFLVTSYLTRIGVVVLPQPPYRPDMSPPDFFLFPKVKRCLKGHRFDDIPNIQRAVTKALTGITPTDYSGAYEACKTRWQRCVDAQGEFFEEYSRFVQIGSINLFFYSLPHIGGWAILARNRVYCSGGVDGIVGCVCFGDRIPEEGSKIGRAVKINLNTIWAKVSGNGNRERGIWKIADCSISRGGPRSSGIKRVSIYEFSWVSCSESYAFVAFTVMSHPNSDCSFYIRQLIKKSAQLSRWRCHLRFNRICKDHQFIPPSLRIKDPVRNPFSEKITKKYQWDLLESRIQGCHSNIRIISKTVKGLIFHIGLLLPMAEFTEVIMSITRDIQHKEKILTGRQQTKMSYWVKKYQFPQSAAFPNNSSNGIVNLSSIPLSEKEERVLALGLHYVPPDKPDIPRLIAGVEGALKNLNHMETLRIRHAVTQVLRRPYHPVSYARDHRSLIQKLRKTSSLVISKADKGNQTVLMDRADYEGKMMNILADTSTFTIISTSAKDALVKGYKSSLRNLMKAKQITKAQLTQFTDSLTRDAFVQEITQMQLPAHHTMVSFDVTALYLSLPHALILNKLQSFLKAAGIQDQTITLITQLTSLCLSISTLTFNHQHYKQIRGTPMGSPLSSIVAEVVMGSLDQWINQMHSSDIHYWRRYVDDIFCVIKPNELRPILNTLHSFHSDIKFTYETETNLVLPFLDILIIRTPHRLHTAVYYKKDIPPLYTHFSSNSPVAYKVNTVRTLTKRIHTHCSLPIFKAIEKNRITTLLTTAGYPRKFIDRHTFDPTAPRTSTTYRAVCYLPYSSFSVAISRILRPYGIQVYFNSPPNLAALLRNPITKADAPNNPIHSTGAVYAVSYQDCPASYVGETGRTAYIRITEHKRNINNRDPKSLIYQHISNTGHNFNLDHPKILYQHINNKQHRLETGEPILLFNIYHPPDKPGPELQQITHLLTDKTILLGDFNSKHPTWGCNETNNCGEALSNYLDNTDLLCISEGPTYVSNSYAKKTIPRGNRKQYIPGYIETINSLQNEITQRNQAQECLMENNELENKINLSKLSAQVRQKANQLKHRKWRDICSNLGPHTRDTKLWKLIKSINQETPYSTTSNTFTDKDGNVLTERTQISNLFADYYTQISKLNFTRQDKKVLHISKKIRNEAKTTSHQDLFHKPFLPHELKETINRLDDNKTPGSDIISAKMIKHLETNAILELLHIINLSWSSSTLPKEWKHAIIIPIHKAGKTENHPQSYRPISLTSIPCKLMERMILNRMQYFLNKNKLFQGLPQGSILSPLLFSIYLNDMDSRITKYCDFALYADDIIIWSSKRDLKEANKNVNKALKELQSFAEKMKLIINPNKSEVGVFTINNHLKKWTPNIKYDNNQINFSRTPKYLGVTLDPSLTYGTHINQTVLRAKKRLNILKRKSGYEWGADRDTLRQTYLALIRPILEYGQPVWQTASKTNLNKIDQVQSSAARIISGLRNTCPTKIPEIEANLLPLTHRRKIGLANYIYKRVNAPKSHRTGEFIRK